ncbi:MAG TPA: nodulation protein NfeD [Ignavibacteriaceae bacterium]|nr:nodulation protein NfeD [Ignavibacteriaceae bacterium]
MKTIIIILISLLVLLSQNVQRRHIDVLKIDGTINPASADFINGKIKNANQQKAECLIIQLNTPGGLLKSTRNIVSSIFSSEIPIIVYVYPPGAQAASAGVFITIAANIAVMGPGTNIGAAHPVMLNDGGSSGKDSTDIHKQKSTNDAAAWIRSIAEKRNRNIILSEKVVIQSLSFTESEAVKEKLVDFTAKNLDSLLSKLDNYKILMDKGEVIIHTKNAKINIIEMTLFQKILDLICDPNLAYIFMMIGFYGLFFELANPGSILPGVVGLISIILAFYSFSSFPLNYSGIVLILFAFVLFIAEIKVISHGLLAIGGVISFLLGSMMLISSDDEISFQFVSISLNIIITATVLTTMFFLFALGKGIAAQKKKPTTGEQGMIGEVGTALSDINIKLNGQILVHGEIWSAESNDDDIKEGMNIKVMGIKNLKLIVKKI